MWIEYLPRNSRILSMLASLLEMKNQKVYPCYVIMGGGCVSKVCFMQQNLTARILNGREMVEAQIINVSHPYSNSCQVKITYAMWFLYSLNMLYDFDLCSSQAFFCLFFHVIYQSHLNPSLVKQWVVRNKSVSDFICVLYLMDF